MNRWKWSVQRCLGASAFLFLTGICLAASIPWVKVTVRLDGVDTAGNPSTANGASVKGKAYKDAVSGIIVQVAAGVVVNQTRKPHNYADRGLSVVDPSTITATTPTTFTATNDVEMIGAPYSGQFAGAGQVAVYDPRYAP